MACARACTAGGWRSPATTRLAPLVRQQVARDRADPLVDVGVLAARSGARWPRPPTSPARTANGSTSAARSGRRWSALAPGRRWASARPRTAGSCPSGRRAPGGARRTGARSAGWPGPRPGSPQSSDTITSAFGQVVVRVDRLRRRPCTRAGAGGVRRRPAPTGATSPPGKPSGCAWIWSASVGRGDGLGQDADARAAACALLLGQRFAQARSESPPRSGSRPGS